MKQLLYLLPLPAFSLLSSCQEEALKTFGDEHYIYFDKFYKNASAPGKETADSTLASFFFFTDDVNTIDVPVVVHMAGRDLAHDETFQLKMIPEMTTATANEYKLDDHYTFRARPAAEGATNRSDTIIIKMFRSARLGSMPHGVKLTVELVPMGGLRLGQTERTRAILVLTRDAIKPKWWNREVTDNLLGEYSSRKYKLFLMNVDKKAKFNGDLIRTAPHKAIELVMQFKKWLADHPAEAVEEDGSKMTVKV